MCTVSKPYPKEFRDDVVRVARNREPGVHLKQIAADFGISETCRTNWMKFADVEDGVKPSTTAAESGAKAVGKEGLFGSLEVGKSADFIVLDRNLFAVDPQEIDGAVVLQTIFEGTPDSIWERLGVTVYRDERAR